ncbi:MAG: PPOX class F420-dependent oxidoreductase [Thaumarchaeota archaeon]|nr:MAG: PPOX class F420-dependent oxidoreductase [Nitrososphaerota archaeon]
MKEKQESVKFTEKEAEYLVEQRLGRIATASPDLEPHVVPVGFEFDGSYIYFGGWSLGRTLKFRNIMRNNKVAFVVDDLVSMRPWRVRGIEIRGIAEKVECDEGRVCVRITPTRKVSWGLEV